MKKIVLTMFALTLIFSCKTNQENKERQQPDGERPTSSQLISEMDADKDGKLSMDEVKGPIANDFENIDSDNDNFISLEELDKAEKTRENRPPRQEESIADLSNEIETSAKVVPVNTDYFITENIIGEIQEKTV
ncbi:EF-hand domain-containing protein [Maribacter sp. HS]